MPSVVNMLQNVSAQALAIVTLLGCPSCHTGAYFTDLGSLYDNQVIHARPTGFHPATKA